MVTKAAITAFRAMTLALGLAVFGATVDARVSEAFSSAAVDAQLVTAQNGIAKGATTISAGVYLRLGEGWKTYWRSPGEVGLPPQIEWSGSRNIADVTMHWPAPERFTAFGIENFGYKDEVLFPLQVTLKTPGSAADLNVNLSLLTCSTVCVPQEITLRLPIPEGSGLDRKYSALIAEYLAKVPTEGATRGIVSTTSFVSEDRSEYIVDISSDRPFGDPDIFPEFSFDTAFGKPEIRLSEDATRLWAKMPILNFDENAGQQPRLTITDGPMWAVTMDANVTSVRPEPPFKVARLSPGLDQTIWIILVAFLGGLILNAMPCVLPVLSIKLTSVLKADGRNRAQIRLGFLSAAAGVLTFMWSLAAILFALKQSGFNVGWGLQFQSPLFITLMFVVLSIFAGNLLGLFEVQLPSNLSTRLTRMGGTSGYSADYFTGLFGAVLATPCSAPFLGTAVAFALAGDGVDILVVFTSLGAGLAVPYLLFAAFPELVKRLPKPGRWMVLLKAFLGLLLVGTAIWLLYVFVGVSGGMVAVAVTFSTMAIITTLSLSQHIPKGRLIIAGVLFIALVSGVAMAPKSSRKVAEGGKIAWTNFERSEIAKLVSQGNVVFVDVTADWCLTCKANKALVLEKEPVLSAINSAEIVAMQADWTQPNSKISRYLETHNRYAIPFNAVYGPNAPNGIVLPEILTSQAVFDALQAAQPETQ